MKSAIICDLDGTLTSCAHRTHWVNEKPKRWDKFFNEMVYDAPVPAVEEILHEMSDAHTIFLMSGRPEFSGHGDRQVNYRDKTEWWLKKHEIPYDHLLMRPGNDQRQDKIIKRELFMENIMMDYTVKLIIDDRPQVIEGWIELGLEDVLMTVTDPGLDPIGKP